MTGGMIKMMIAENSAEMIQLMTRGMIEMMIAENYAEMNAGEIAMVNAETENAIGRICVIATCVIERTIVTFLVNATETRLYFIQVTVSMRITTEIGENAGINYLANFFNHLKCG